MRERRGNAGEGGGHAAWTDRRAGEADGHGERAKMRVRIIRIELKCRASYQNLLIAQQFQAAYKGIRPRLIGPDDRRAAPGHPMNCIPSNRGRRSCRPAFRSLRTR